MVDLTGLTLEELAKHKGNVSVGGGQDQEVNAEFLRRQMIMQAEITQAAKDTAIYTQSSARHMRNSVIVLAVSAVISAGVAVVQWQEGHSKPTGTVATSSH